MTDQPVALITGGGTRLGRIIAEHLGQSRYHLAIHYNSNDQGIHEIRNSLGAHCQLSSHRADFSMPQAAPGIVHDVIHQYGRIDLLVNNAAVFPNQELQNFDPETMLTTFAINCVAPLALTQAFAAHCTHGHIINILDARISHRHPQRFVYSLSKQALAQATQHSALCLAPSIRVNGICPGPVLPASDGGHSFDHTVATSPLAQATASQDILSGIDYLLHNTSVTGELLFIDSGQHLDNSQHVNNNQHTDNNQTQGTSA